jgi:hypothetical protein
MLNISPVGGGSNCPSSGIRYIPKRSAPPSNPRPTITHQPGQPEPTGPVEPRRGNLRVYTGDDQQQRGCLISHGTWFTSGTCATFKAKDVTGVFATFHCSGTILMTIRWLSCPNAQRIMRLRKGCLYLRSPNPKPSTFPSKIYSLHGHTK